MYLRYDSNTAISLYHDYLFWTKFTDSIAVFEEYVRLANFALDRTLRKIYQVDGRWQHHDANHSEYPIDVQDLVAGQDNYVLADEHLRISRVRMKNREGNWITLTPKDRSHFSDDDLAETGNPELYDKLGPGIFPVPIPDYAATGGVEVTYQKGSNYFTTDDTNKAPGFASIFHRYVSLLPAQDACATNELNNQLKAVQNAIQQLDQEVLEFYATREQDGVQTLDLKKSNRGYGTYFMQ